MRVEMVGVDAEGSTVFRHCPVHVALLVERLAEVEVRVGKQPGIVGVETDGGAEFGHRTVKVALVFERDAEVVVQPVARTRGRAAADFKSRYRFGNYAGTWLYICQ